jgi:transcriptional regulator GlxA family with amidase domain
MPYIIVIPIYEQVNLLDVAAPREMFGWWEDADKSRDIQIVVAAETKGVVGTFSPNANGTPERAGLRIVADSSFSEIARADLLWVPGGSIDALREQMKSPTYMAFLKRIALDAAYVTSVCEGAILLAHAGLLDGFRATTHWAFIQCLAKYKRVQVVPDPNLPDPKFPRFVFDDHNGTLTKGIRVTGGGISSGLDESLEIIRRIAGADVAKIVQTTTQYFPKPPVQAPEPSFVECPSARLSPD